MVRRGVFSGRKGDHTKPNSIILTWTNLTRLIRPSRIQRAVHISLTPIGSSTSRPSRPRFMHKIRTKVAAPVRPTTSPKKSRPSGFRLIQLWRIQRVAQYYSSMSGTMTSRRLCQSLIAVAHRRAHPVIFNLFLQTQVAEHLPPTNMCTVDPTRHANTPNSQSSKN